AHLLLLRTRPTHSSPLSLHDALPISRTRESRRSPRAPSGVRGGSGTRAGRARAHSAGGSRLDASRCRDPCAAGHFSSVTPWPERSEEHTSELQSRENLVCRLLLEKKK